MSKVSRSVYQKLKEENKRLMRDLRIICSRDSDMAASVMCEIKWADHFEKEYQAHTFSYIKVFNEAI